MMILSIVSHVLLYGSWCCDLIADLLVFSWRTGWKKMCSLFRHRWWFRSCKENVMIHSFLVVWIFFLFNICFFLWLSQRRGRLLYAGLNEWIHANCALWSAEVYEEVDGSLQNVHLAVNRGKLMVRFGIMHLVKLETGKSLEF